MHNYMSSIGLYFCAASIGMVFVPVWSEMGHCFFFGKKNLKSFSNYVYANRVLVTRYRVRSWVMCEIW